MIKIKLNNNIQLLLIVILFTSQLINVHGHVSEQHNHEKTLHQHVEVHTHQYVKNMDNTHPVSDTKIIDFEDEYVVKNKIVKKINHIDVAILSSNLLPSFLYPDNIVPDKSSVKLRSSIYLSINSRAPPFIS